MELTSSLEDNKSNILEFLKNNKDISCRKIISCGKTMYLIIILGLVDKELINDSIIRPIINLNHFDDGDITNFIKNKVLYTSQVEILNNFNDVIFKILKGNAILLTQDCYNVLAVDCEKLNLRAIEEPPTSAVVKGPREGFNESIKTNLALVRKRLATPDLIINNFIVGKETKTQVNIMYISKIVDMNVVNSISKRIKNIDIDGVLDSHYIAQFLQENKQSIFKQIGTTEKPDVVVSKLLEGRVAIFVDGSPIVLTLPFILFEDYQNVDDYYKQSQRAAFERWLRIIGLSISVLFPGLYVSLQLYHYSIIPLKFLVTIANTTQGLPFPPLMEILVIIILFEILNEASIRMPKHLGLAMSIVGALILGDTAVNAGLISPPAVMIVAVSSITIFIVPDQSGQLSLLRMLFTLLGGMLGLYGMILGGIFLINYLSNFNSYGAPYLAPLSPYIKSDFKDFMNKKPLNNMILRPKSIPNNKYNSKRMKK
jgi:spore germination protein KA